MSATAEESPGGSAAARLSDAGNRKVVLWGLVGFAILLMLLKPVLPGLSRLPNWMILPWDVWLDAAFDWVQNDLKLTVLTRKISDGLAVLIDAAGNVLYGKSRWPNLGQIPWSAIAALAGMVGYHLGGWRLALLSAGTCVYAALMGQWKWTMETMSVIVIAAPISFFLGLCLGILAWKYKGFEKFIKPALAVLQTLPFLSYLLPAVIFFKVGPTAAAVATIVYAMPPMVLMTTIGLKKVPAEVVEAGLMCGCTRWQMLRKVYLPSARTEILVGLNQVIMLSLAMVVLTSFIGMPGLGAKLLAMMNSFKLGRSFEIGITIVLLAVVLDRLTKAWVTNQPEHFEKGTSWWRRNWGLLSSLAVFLLFLVLGYFSNQMPNYTLGAESKTPGTVFQYLFSVLGDVHRTQDWSMGKPMDTAIKTFLGWDWVQAITGAVRYVFNIWVLIPTEKMMLYVPTYAMIALISAFCFALGGWRPAVLGAVFFAAVAQFGWWDRAMLTLHSTLIAVCLSMLLGIPLAIWAARAEARANGAILVCDTFQTFPSFIYLLPAIMLFGITPVTVIMSILIYTMVPVVRYTIEGLRAVPKELTEAAEMSGATRSQKLWKVELPLAMPTIAVGLNQALMFAFFMVIIAAFIGTRDLGQELQRTMAGTVLGKNFVLGFSVVLMALTFDIAINAWAERRRRALGLA